MHRGTFYECPNSRIPNNNLHKNQSIRIFFRDALIHVSDMRKRYILLAEGQERSAQAAPILDQG
jgi:hypothetical protein